MSLLLPLGMHEPCGYKYMYYIPTQHVCFVFCSLIVVGFRIRVHV